MQNIYLSHMDINYELINIIKAEYPDVTVDSDLLSVEFKHDTFTLVARVITETYIEILELTGSAIKDISELLVKSCDNVNFYKINIPSIDSMVMKNPGASDALLHSKDIQFKLSSCNEDQEELVVNMVKSRNYKIK